MSKLIQALAALSMTGLNMGALGALPLVNGKGQLTFAGRRPVWAMPCARGMTLALEPVAPQGTRPAGGFPRKTVEVSSGLEGLEGGGLTVEMPVEGFLPADWQEYDRRVAAIVGGQLLDRETAIGVIAVAALVRAGLSLEVSGTFASRLWDDALVVATKDSMPGVSPLAEFASKEDGPVDMGIFQGAPPPEEKRPYTKGRRQ